MIKKIVNTILIFVAISLYTLILGAAYCSGKEISDYTAFTLILITPISYLIILYTSGKFDNYINNTLEPSLQKLLRWFNRRNLMLLIVLISFTGCVKSQINEDTAYIVSCHKLNHNTKFLYKYEITSGASYISSYFYSNEEFQVGKPIKLCPR